MTTMLSFLSTNESVDNSDNAIKSFNPHWSSFYPHWSIPIVCSLSIIGLCGNILVCFTIWKATFLHTTTNYLIVNLAITDSLVCLFSTLQLLWSKLVFPSSEIAKHIFCHLLASEVWLFLSTTSSAAALILVSLERFIGVVYPLHYQLLITAKRVRIAITFQWITALIAEAFNAVFSFYDGNENDCIFNVHVGFYALQSIISYVLPVVTLIYLYCRMFLSLKINLRPNGESNNFEARMEQNRRARRNILMNLFIVTILFVAFLTPGQVMFLLRYFVDITIDDVTNTITLYILLLCNSVVNPIVYCFRYKQFQKALKIHVLRIPF